MQRSVRRTLGALVAVGVMAAVASPAQAGWGWMPVERQDAPVIRVSGPAVQDAFLRTLRQTQTPVAMFLVNGVKLQGVIVGFDRETIILRVQSVDQLVYKHAISTIAPSPSS